MTIGFGRIKPFGSTFRLNSYPNYKINPVKLRYAELVDSYKPLRFMTTLTFSKNLTQKQCCKFISIYLHRHNRKLFGPRYYRSHNFIKGFMFFEKHASLNSINDTHVHMLIKDNIRYDDFSFAEHEQLFRSAASKVLDNRKRRIFNDKCIDIQEVKDDGAISYCFKQIWDGNLTRIKTIDRGGLSDDL